MILIDRSHFILSFHYVSITFAATSQPFLVRHEPWIESTIVDIRILFKNIYQLKERFTILVIVHARQIYVDMFTVLGKVFLQFIVKLYGVRFLIQVCERIKVLAQLKYRPYVEAQQGSGN